jgi:hypothetical protein
VSVGASGYQPAMRWHESKRSPKRCQAQASDHNPYALEDEAGGVQPPGVRTAGAKQRSTERAEIRGDPDGNASTHQCWGATNAKQHR